MKNFLKSTAIFACIALLFCACSEDTTEDITLPNVDASGIRSLTPGNGKFEVTWSVPSDEQVTICRVSWSNGSGVDGEYVVKADLTQVMSYTTTTTLPAGEYTVTLENFGDEEIDSPSTSKKVTVYDSSSYSAPVVETAMVETATSGVNMLLEWDATFEDCEGVILAYYAADGSKVTSSLLSFDQASFIEGVKSGTKYSYTTFFQPEGGLDPVVLVSEDAGTVPTVASSAPNEAASVVVNSGDYKFKVTVTPQSGVAYPERFVIIYTNGETVYYKYTSSVSGTIVEDFEDMPLETYTVSVRSITGTQMSSAVAGDSEAAVYDLIAYTEACSLPTYVAMYYDKVFTCTSTSTDFSQPLCINWSENIDCEKLTISYTKSSNGDIEKDYDITNDAKEGTTTVLTNATPGSEFLATTIFRPSGNGLDTVTKVQSSQLPYAPVPKSLDSWGGSNGTTRYRHYFITPIGDGVTEDGVHSPDCNATGNILLDNGKIDSKGSQLYGEAVMLNGGISDYYWEELWDNTYDYSTSTTSSGRKQFISNSSWTQWDQTVSYDLGATFQLSSIVYTPHLSNLLSNNTITSFSLYGLSADKDPLDKTLYDIATAETQQYLGTDYEYLIIPDLSNWECLLSYQSVVQPSTNNIDYNGDGVVDSTDDADMIYDGVSFDIPSTAPAVRYLRLQIHDTANGGLGYMIMELDHYHKGSDLTTYDGEAYQHTIWNSNMALWYPGIVMSNGVYTVPEYNGTTEEDD